MLPQTKLAAGALIALMIAARVLAGQVPGRPVYNEIIGTGQSLSTGLFANPPISTTPQWPTVALMTNLGVRQVPDRGRVYCAHTRAGSPGWYRWWKPGLPTATARPLAPG